jgi:peptidoglycan lytic transglycosylase
MVMSAKHRQGHEQSDNQHQSMGRQSLRAALALTVLMVLSACSSGGVNLSANGSRWGAPVSANVRLGANKRHGHDSAYASGSSAQQKIGRPYQISGRTYVPARQDDYDRTGVASWYGPKFHGRKTANGEVFDMNSMSAAHTTLPLPSLVRVTNLDNGRSIIVRVNDRGPFVNNRLIDLSKSAARELGYIRQGTARVRVQYVGPAVSNPGRVNIRRASTQGQKARVWPAPNATPSLSRSAPFNPDQGWPEASKDKYPMALSRPRIAQGGWFVQVGAFGDRDRAERIANTLRNEGNTSVQTAWINNRYIHRVLVGPFPNREGAEQQRYDVANVGYPEARVTEQR